MAPAQHRVSGAPRQAVPVRSPGFSLGLCLRCSRDNRLKPGLQTGTARVHLTCRHGSERYLRPWAVAKPPSVAGYGEIGNHLLGINAMHYNHVCLRCRFVSKRPSWGTAQICPRCRSGMVLAGTAFRAPPQRDTKQWNRIIALLRQGYRFDPDLGSPFPPERIRPVNRPRRDHSKKPQPSSIFRKPARKR